MIMICHVAKLMHDYIFDTMNRRLYQIYLLFAGGNRRKDIDAQFRRYNDTQPFAVPAMKGVGDLAGAKCKFLHGLINPHLQWPPRCSGR